VSRPRLSVPPAPRYRVRIGERALVVLGLDDSSVAKALEVTVERRGASYYVTAEETARVRQLADEAQQRLSDSWDLGEGTDRAANRASLRRLAYQAQQALRAG